jgi:hypothetical protein
MSNSALSQPQLWAYLPFLRVLPASTALRGYFAAHLGTCWQVRTLGAGAGGDCLFHTFGAILEHMLTMGPASAAHVRSSLPPNFFNGSSRSIVQHLRGVCADAWAQKDWLDILNFLVGGAQRERIPGACFDGWSPARKLESHHFGVLAECDSVLALGPDETGDPGDLRVAVVTTDASMGAGAAVEEILVIEQGEAYLATLLQAMQTEFRMCGNNHWADTSDLKSLSEKLNIGSLLFADGLQDNGKQMLCSLDRRRGNFLFFAGIWWQDPIHFRVAEVQTSSEQQFCSCWQQDAIPAELRDQYNACNPHANIGAGQALDVS